MDGQVARGTLFPDFEITGEDTVLDVGCGSGPDCVFAGRLGAAVIGIDIEPLELERAAAAMREVPARSFQTLLTDCNPIPLPDATADVVICKEVLEHVDDPRVVLAELRRVGKPGARYLFSVPDPASEELMRVVSPAWYFQKPIHQHVYARGQFDNILRESGFEVIRRDYLGFYYSLWWVFRMAVGTDYHEGHPTAQKPAILDAWERTWKELESTPHLGELSQRLDQLIPKSQVVTARKATVPSPSPAIRAPFWSRLRRATRPVGQG
jgi:SAM-dependent methyltransferase